MDEDQVLDAARREESGASYTSEMAYRVLQDAIWDHHYWLSVTTLCAVGRLGLKEMRRELDQAAQHSVPLVALAAQLAQQLITLT
jgi:hypothetical protein